MGLIGLHGLLLLPPVSAKVLRQAAQVLRPSGGGLPLGGQGRQLLLFPGDLLRQGVGLGQQLRLPRQGLLRLGPERRGLGLLGGHQLLRLRGPPGVVRQTACEALQLALQILPALPQGAQEDVKVVPGALQPQDLVLGPAALALRRLQLVLRGGQLPAGGLLRLLGVLQGLVHSPGPAVQLLKLRRPAQHARGAGGGAAGHGAAAVDHLAVQSDDAEGVLVLPGHGNAAVHVLDDHRAAQKALKDVPVLLVKGDEAGGDTHKAELPLHALLPQLATPDGGERQEGGAAAVPLLEVVDGAFSVLLPVHHNVLEPRPQGNLNGQAVLPLGPHQIRHGAMDSPEAALRLHHSLDRLGKPLVLLLHLRQQADAVVQGAGVHGQLHPLIRGGGGLLSPLLHPQAVSCDDVGHGLRLIPGVLQGPAVGLGLLLRLLQLGPGGGQLALHRGLPLGDLAVLRGQGGGGGPVVCGSGYGNGLLGPQGLRLVLGPACPLGGGPGPVQQVLQRPAQGLQRPVDVRHAGLLLLRLLLKVSGTAVRLLQLLAGTQDVLLVVGDGALQHRHGRLLLRRLRPQAGGLRPDGLSLHILGPHLFAELLPLAVEGVQGRPGLVTGGLGGAEVRLGLSGLDLQIVQILQPHGDLQKAQLIPEDQILFRLLRLVPQGLHLELQLRDLVVDPHQVLLGALQLPLGVLFPVAELGDAGGLLEDLPPVAAAGGENLVNPALADDGVALLAHAGVHEELRHVLEPDGLAVDVVLALAAAVIAAGHRNLRFLHRGEDALGVVQHQRHLGKAHLGPLLGAAEDDILHLGPPEPLSALLAHDPADGVGDIALAGAVGPHDGGDVLAKVQNGLVGEGFKALNFQCFQVHNFTSPDFHIL